MGRKSNPWFFYYGLWDGDSIMHLAAGSYDLDILKTALRNGGDPNCANPRLGKTPIFSAIFQELPYNVEALLEAGADVNHADGHGSTPLARAMQSSKYHIALILLEAGADWRAADKNGNRIDFHFLLKEEYGTRLDEAGQRVLEFIISKGWDREEARKAYEEFYDDRGMDRAPPFMTDGP